MSPVLELVSVSPLGRFCLFGYGCSIIYPFSLASLLLFLQVIVIALFFVSLLLTVKGWD